MFINPNLSGIDANSYHCDCNVLLLQNIYSLPDVGFFAPHNIKLHARGPTPSGFVYIHIISNLIFDLHTGFRFIIKISCCKIQR